MCALASTECLCIVPNFSSAVNKYRSIFYLSKHILLGMPLKGVIAMQEQERPALDLDDLLFREEEHHPSER